MVVCPAAPFVTPTTGQHHTRARRTPADTSAARTSLLRGVPFVEWPTTTPMSNTTITPSPRNKPRGAFLKHAPLEMHSPGPRSCAPTPNSSTPSPAPTASMRTSAMMSPRPSSPPSSDTPRPSATPEPCPRGSPRRPAGSAGESSSASAVRPTRSTRPMKVSPTPPRIPPRPPPSSPGSRTPTASRSRSMNSAADAENFFERFFSSLINPTTTGSPSDFPCPGAASAPRGPDAWANSLNSSITGTMSKAVVRRLAMALRSRYLEADRGLWWMRSR